MNENSTPPSSNLTFKASPSERRRFLTWSAGAAGMLTLGGPFMKAFAASCGFTPSQTSGPFYPGEKNITVENDLTTVAGSSVRALGQVVYVRGRVVDANCKPIADANVEIWQACASGRYNSEKDPNTAAPLDPNFKYWGEAYTNDQGQYEFKTIIPGAYPAASDWERPPHLHFRVTKLGYRELVTQMYFKGDPLNDKDYILQGLKPVERDNVVVEFKASSPELEPRSLTGHFEITLRSVR